MSDRRIFIQCLASYNAGHIVGHWVDLDGHDVETLMQETYGILAKCKEPNVVGYEAECACGHSHKGIGTYAASKGDHVDCPRCSDQAVILKVYPSGEEWMIADTEGLGDHVGEYTSFDTIGALIETLDSLTDDEHADAYLAWWGDVGGDMPTKDEFDDAYMGEWDRFQDYSDEHVDDCILSNTNINETLRTYFDYERFARDYEMDHTVVDNPDGGVWIFNN